jgi:hypothetical protein
MWRVFYCRDCGGEAGVKYTKPALSFEQQADQLLNRGFQADATRLIETLSRVSYYRLSDYWHPFKRPDESFAPRNGVGPAADFAARIFGSGH